MHLRTDRFRALLSLVMPLACAPVDPTPPEAASLLVRGAIHYTDDVGGFAYTVVGVDCQSGARLPDADAQSATVREADLYLPSGAPAVGGDGPVYGEHTFVLVPGCYDITSSPLRGATDEPSEYCLPAHARAVEVAEGLTTEVMLISQCPGPARPTEDVGPGTNEPPTIAMTIAGPDAPVAACEGVELCVTALDPDGDPIEFVWEVVAGAPAIPPSALITTRAGDGSLTQCAVTQIGSVAELGLRVIAYDLARGDDRRHVRIEEHLRELGDAAGSRASAEIPLQAAESCTIAGRSLTILLALYGPEGRAMPAADARRLAGNAARWVGEGDAPRVLVVRDQNHRGEDLGGVDRLVEDLRAELGAANVDRVDEEDLPTPGDLELADLDGYDVVWFVNPGAPIDSLTTFGTLLDFRGGGGGVVVQGDDVAHFQSPAALADALTLTHYENGGTMACGRPIDGWGEHAYQVAFAALEHPVLAGLSGSFAYANDVDHVTPAGVGEAVLATASFGAGGCEVATPAMIAVDPALVAGALAE